MRPSIWQPAVGIAGEVVTASVRNPLENPTAEGKVRPAVLVRRDGGSWYIMGLTTRSTYRDSTPRTPVPDPYAVGLNRRGFLWGNRLTRLSVLDVEHHLGWVNAALVSTIILQARLGPEDAAALVMAIEDAQRVA